MRLSASVSMSATSTDRAAGQVADAVDRIEPGEAEHQVAEVIDERRIGEAEAALKDVLAEAGEEAGQTPPRAKSVMETLSPLGD